METFFNGDSFLVNIEKDLIKERGEDIYDKAVYTNKYIIKKFKAHNSVIYSVDFSADVTRLLTASGESTELKNSR